MLCSVRLAHRNKFNDDVGKQLKTHGKRINLSIAQTSKSAFAQRVCEMFHAAPPFTLYLVTASVEFNETHQPLHCAKPVIQSPVAQRYREELNSISCLLDLRTKVVFEFMKWAMRL